MPRNLVFKKDQSPRQIFLQTLTTSIIHPSTLFVVGKYIRMDTISTLPYELAEQIVNGVTYYEQMNLRLTCKTLHDHATPLLFRRVYIWLEASSLQKLVNIATAARLSDHVRHISCGMEDFHDVEFDTFKRHRFTNGYNFLDDTETRAAHQLYQTYAQRQTLGEGWIVHSMTTAFKNLRKLQSMDITGTFDSDYGLALLAKEPLLRRSMLKPMEVDGPTGGRQLRVVLKALASTQQLAHLSLRIGYWHTGGEGSLLSPLSDEHRRFVQHAFGSLKTLHLKLPQGISQALQKHDDRMLSTCTIIEAAASLDCLTLEIPGTPDLKENPEAFWPNLIGTHKIGNLRKVSISGLIVKESDLVNFLLQSCRQLVELRLFRLGLTKGSWDTVFDSIRRLRLLETVSVHRPRHIFFKSFVLAELECCEHEVDSAHGSLHDYLCNRSEVNPWPLIQKRLTDNSIFKVIMEAEIRSDGPWVDPLREYLYDHDQNDASPEIKDYLICDARPWAIRCF